MACCTCWQLHRHMHMAEVVVSIWQAGWPTVADEVGMEEVDAVHRQQMVAKCRCAIPLLFFLFVFFLVSGFQCFVAACVLTPACAFNCRASTPMRGP